MLGAASTQFRDMFAFLSAQNQLKASFILGMSSPKIPMTIPKVPELERAKNTLTLLTAKTKTVVFPPILGAHPCFLLPCSPHPPPGNFSSPKTPLSGTSNLLFRVEKRQTAGAGFCGRFWTRSPHREKKKEILFFFSGANKGEF